MKWLLALFLLTAPAWSFPVDRCVNLDNALNSPHYEGEWGYRIRDADLGRIRRAGFDTVRLPVDFASRWNGTRIDATFQKRVDTVIRAALDRDLSVILTFYGFDALRDDPEDNEPTFRAIWSALSAHYAGWPEDLIFELYSEPAGRLTPRRLNTLYARTLPVIRAHHPTRWIVLGGANWASLDGLRHLARPDSRTALTFHYYEPWDFTHQGAEWLDPAPPETRWGSRADRARIVRDMARAAQRGGPVFMGEFGVNHRVRTDLRWDWTATVRRAAERNGISWCHWGFATTFPLYDRHRGRWLDGALPTLFD